MMRTYEYHGFSLEVVVESGFSWPRTAGSTPEMGYLVTARIFQAGAAVAVFSPLRFGETRGRPFVTEGDALMGGYSAARRIVDDLLGERSH